MGRVPGEKFKLDTRSIKDTLELIKDIAEVVETSSHLRVILDPEGDNRVLECAVDGKADFIITGDTKHILPIKE